MLILCVHSPKISTVRMYVCTHALPKKSFEMYVQVWSELSPVVSSSAPLFMYSDQLKFKPLSRWCELSLHTHTQFNLRTKRQQRQKDKEAKKDKSTKWQWSNLNSKFAICRNGVCPEIVRPFVVGSLCCGHAVFCP